MSKVDRAVCHAIFKRGLRNSWYFLQSGRPAQAYLNIDTAMLGDDYDSDSTTQHERIEQIVEQFGTKIQEIEQENPFERLVFIDKAGHGPVGMIALSSLLIWRLKKDAVFVRPYRNTLRASSKGRNIEPGERLLIVSDVATTGETILKAASKLWEAGAVVIGALVFYDQELGATENLSSKDLLLYSLNTRIEVLEDPEIRERLPDKEETFFREFGGVM